VAAFVASGTVLVAALSSLLGGVASPSDTRTPRRKANDVIRGSITVAAASSLTDAFTRIAARLERAHPDAVVRLTFDASSRLAFQIEQGAGVDVFASADDVAMRRVVNAIPEVSPVVFSWNRLAIAVPPGNPRRVHGLRDLKRLDTVALCVTAAPCGRYAEEALAKAGVRMPHSRIARVANARAAVTSVTPGDADAAITYVTDVRAAGRDVELVPIPERHNVSAPYSIATLPGPGSRVLAKAFVHAVQSPRGRVTLARYGFLPA
jgi:molybdate transport system substrate-binding protein